MQDKNIEGFLKAGTTYYPTLWDDQIGYFLLMLPFIAFQLIKTPILPAISFFVEIALLLYCRKARQGRYGNVYCYFVHILILLLIMWTDGWVAISYTGKIENIYEMIILGTCIYAICVYIRVVVVEYKISHGFYTREKKKNNAKEIGVAVGIAVVALLRGIKFQMSQEAAYGILAGCCFILAFMFLKITDLGMMCFYFGKLSSEEQKSVVGK